MDDANPPAEQAQIVDFAGQLIQKTSRVHLNLEQELIFTTEDKVRLCLTKHLSRMDRSKAWVTPLGILLTILIVFPTTSFRDFIVSAETWQAMFIISGVLSFAWLLRAIWQARVSSSLDSVVAEIKRTAIAHEKETVDSSLKDTTVTLSTDIAREELIIQSAKYGARDNIHDVTQLLTEKIAAGRLEIHASNHDLGGDPYPGVVKSLTVVYSYKGHTATVTISEDEILSLP